MRTVTIAASVLASIGLGTTPVFGQTSAWGNNGAIGFSALYQVSTTTFDEESTFELYKEQATVSATHEIEAGPVWEVSGAGRIYKNLGFGFAVSYFEGKDNAQIEAGLPHPFFFERPRIVSGEATELDRQELGIHLDAMVLLPLSDRFQVAVFGGPSWFRLKQGLASGVTYSESYPYDEAQFTGVDETATPWEWSRVGYNVGADASVFFSRHFGLGMSVRYSNAEVEFDASSGLLEANVGGTQVGAGLRIRY